MKRAMWSRLPSGWVALGLAAVLAGCGGGGADSASGAPTLGGTAAVGAPIVGGSVAVQCAGGSTLTATTGSAGGWTVAISGQTLPCAVRVSGGTIEGAANAASYHSIALDFGRVNVTPLTDLVLARLVAGGPQAWFDAPDFAVATATALDAARSAVSAALGLDDALGGRDPLTANFSPSAGDPLDDVLAAIRGAMAALTFDHAALLAAAGSGDFAAIDGFGAAFATALAELGGTPGSCDSGTAMVFSASGNGGPYSNGQQVCFTASPTSLAFAGQTLTDPQQNTAVQLPYAAYTFTDGELSYEVVFNDGALYEINVVGSSFLGQFALAASGGTTTLTVDVRINGTPTATISVGAVPAPASEAEFCGSISGDDTFASLGTQGGGTLTVTGCSYADQVGIVEATLSGGGLSLAYTVFYRYE